VVADDVVLNSLLVGLVAPLIDKQASSLLSSTIEDRVLDSAVSASFDAAIK
jgi:hypothetical protein